MIDLNTIWFALVGVLLIGYAILDGFDLGVGMLHLFIAKDDRERRILVNSIGPVWDGNEVWLLTGGGAIFAAFPNVYATVFSGFYIALMLVLTALILRSVSLEFRGKVDKGAWRTSWDFAFAIGSFLPALLFGVAIGNILRGVPIDAQGEYAGSFFTLLNPFALVCGVLSTVMFLMQGASWLMVRTEGELRNRATKVGIAASRLLIVLWAVLMLWSRQEAPHTWTSSGVLPWFPAAIFLICTVWMPRLLRGELSGGWAFAISSTAIAMLLLILGFVLFPNMVPALGNPGNSLTIYNAASSERTLTTMLVIAACGMPVVIGYTIFIYSKFFKPVVLDDHSY